MIKLQELTPRVYYNKSRDFQFIGRLYDLVLNSVKTNTDIIDIVPLGNGVDSKLIDLMTMTLGFKAKHNYNIKQLTALCSAFMQIIKNKGNIQSIELAGNTLINAEGITKDFFCEMKYDKNGNMYLEVIVPKEFTDTSLFKDLLNYILPAGIGIKIITNISFYKSSYTSLELNDNVVTYVNRDYATSYIPKIETEAVYLMTTEQPNDWAFNYYKSYYTKNTNNEYVLIGEFANKPEFIPSTEQEWYFGYLEIRQGEVGEYIPLKTKPSDWDRYYYNYFEYKQNTGEWVQITKYPTWEEDTYYKLQEQNLTDPRARAYGGLFVNSTIIKLEQAESQQTQEEQVEGENNG